MWLARHLFAADCLHLYRVRSECVNAGLILFLLNAVRHATRQGGMADQQQRDCCGAHPPHCSVRSCSSISHALYSSRVCWLVCSADALHLPMQHSLQNLQVNRSDASRHYQKLYTIDSIVCSTLTVSQFLVEHSMCKLPRLHMPKWQEAVVHSAMQRSDTKASKNVCSSASTWHCASVMHV